jgi:hypothetical protein
VHVTACTLTHQQLHFGSHAVHDHDSYAFASTHTLLLTNPALCMLQVLRASLQPRIDAVASGGVRTQRQQHLALWVVLKL